MLPPTNAVVPIVGVFFYAAIVEMVVMLAVVCLVSSLIHKEPTDPPMPHWIRKVFVEKLSYVFGVKRNHESIGYRNRTTIPKWFSSVEKELLTDMARPSSSASSKADELKNFSEKLDAILANIACNENNDKIKEEWRVVAITIDRLFLSLFALTNVVIITSFWRSRKYVP